MNTAQNVLFFQKHNLYRWPHYQRYFTGGYRYAINAYRALYYWMVYSV